MKRVESREPTGEPEAGDDTRWSARLQPGVKIAVLLSAVFFFVRLLRFVDRNSVDVVFLDQWGFLRPFFDGESLWAAFRYQHGPHRQGVGSIVIFISNTLTDWDIRVLGLVTTWLLVAALMCALWLKVRLYGRLTFMDVVVPPLFFRLSQYESLAVTANPAHGVMPVILLLVACLVLTGSRRQQLVMLPLLAFLAVHTGFGFLVPPVLLTVLLVRCAAEWRAGRHVEMAYSAATILLVLLTTATFFAGYTWTKEAIPCTDEFTPGLADWLAWPVVMVNRFFGLHALGPFTLAVGTLLFVLPGVAFIFGGLIASWWKQRRDPRIEGWARVAVPVVLLGYSLCFAVASATGRICSGLFTAHVSRYVTHMIPFGVGLYFVYVLSRAGLREPGVGFGSNSGTRSVLAQRIVGVFGSCLFVFSLSGSASLTPSDRYWIEQFYVGKQRWRDCILQNVNVANCRSGGPFEFFPDAEMLAPRVEFLRTNRKSLFKNQEVVDGR